MNQTKVVPQQNKQEGPSLPQQYRHALRTGDFDRAKSLIRLAKSNKALQEIFAGIDTEMAGVVNPEMAFALYFG